MVHTLPFSAAEHLAHTPHLGATALSSEAYYRYLRPKHAQYPEHAERYYLSQLRMRAVSPDHVIRVAVADDADAFTDLEMGEDGLWQRGTWENGDWTGRESRLPVADRKVAEGRVLGYTSWLRTWPSDYEAAKQAKTRAGNVWPEDSLPKKLERSLFKVMDKYASVAVGDPAADPERLQRLLSDGVGQYNSYTKPVTDKLDKTTGYIYCVTVAVDPAFHRRGIGARMMRWGLERAEKEGVPVLLIGSQKGILLYEKLGFETLGTIDFDTLSGDKAMIYWPKGAPRIEVQISSAIETDEVRAEEAQVADLLESTTS